MRGEEEGLGGREGGGRGNEAPQEVKSFSGCNGHTVIQRNPIKPTLAFIGGQARVGYGSPPAHHTEPGFQALAKTLLSHRIVPGSIT